MITRISTSLLRTASILTALSALTLGAKAQTQPLEQIELFWVHDTGFVENNSDRPDVIASFTIQVAGSTWLRLFFEEVTLSGSIARGDASFLRVTSHKDGLVQELNARHVQEWSMSTAYLNGDTVQVEIFAYPGTGPNRLRARAVHAGQHKTTYATQCGPTDDRVASFDPRVARTEPNGCTGWMVNACNHCFITAGHCISGANLVEFNVPASLPDGTRQHPGPEDQYSIDQTSKQSQASGVGNDWAVYGVFDNPVTGLSAFEAQGAAFNLAAAAPAFDPALQIRITGHGVDGGVVNQIQQTQVGPYFSNTGTSLRYVTDTQGGNSGSPVIDELTGYAIGVHTHGGCSTGGTGSNAGTNIAHVGWQAAMANPLGICLTNQNDCAEEYCSGKLNSAGCVPFLTTTGRPTATPGTPYQIIANDLVPNQSGLLIYSLAGKANLGFHNGTLCIKSPRKRLFPIQFSGNPGTPPCSGRISINFNNKIQNGSDPELIPGAVVYGQLLQRDPGLGDGFNDTLTDAIMLQVQP